ncbi:MAG: tRNA (adenine(22)-N(1))-methyltransferase TrmK, partial [Thermoproteota archaeon]|nr:tRNA (adenine(22)-N(1))-methyltransferase TrmK [Thermoproteota archaeon]
LERMAEREFVPSIGPIKGKIIKETIRRYRPKNILEIGTLHGYSAILMASTISSSDRKVVAIEINKSAAEIARKNIAQAGLSEKIEVITSNALDAIPKLGQKFQLMFLDAEKDQYLEYLKSAERHCLEKGAVIVADNVKVSKNEMLDYLEYVRNSGAYKSKTVETMLEFTPKIKDAIEISVKIN